MSEPLSRRKMITGGLAVAVTGVAGLAAAERIADRYGLIPPDCGGVWGPGETLTYAAQRMLMAHHSMAREFNRSDVSKAIPVSGEPPSAGLYKELLEGDFKDWRIPIDGMVAQPNSFSVDELKRMPMSSQITHQACEEGWSFIAEWHGVQLSHVLNLVGMSAKAKYVVVYAYDGNWDSLDMADAYHPQTFLTYGLNGNELPTRHGAPLRLKVARQLGYKSVKFLSRITVTDSLKNIGNGKGSISPDYGYSWYAGI
jgi:DMSO/TMAO reductase YedYZ molybdopterin-dependent catalytic subunit